MRARTRWIAGLAAAAILLTATVTAFGYSGQVDAIVGVAAQGTITCGQPFTMTATVLDADGAPVADASIAWSFVTEAVVVGQDQHNADRHQLEGRRHHDGDAGSRQRRTDDPRDHHRGRDGATSEVSASGVVNQSCGGLPRTDTLSPETPQGGAPLAAVLVLVLGFAAGGGLTLRRLAATRR